MTAVAEAATGKREAHGIDGTWVAVLVLAFLALALRLYRLDAVSLRGDEAFTVIFVQRTWEGLWKGMRVVEPNPPLLYLALRSWVALAGTSEFAARFFSAFFGVLCVPLLYRLARTMFAAAGKWTRGVAGGTAATRVALIAGALVAINPYQVWHSQDVRNYTLWPALSLLSLVFLWRWYIVEKKLASSTRLLACYVLAALASLYTHYYDALILIAANLFVFLSLWGQWRALARWIAAQALLALLYLPWILFFTNRVATYGEGSAEQNPSLVDVWSRTLSTFVLSDTVPEALKTALWVPLALGLVAILFYLARRARVAALFLGLYIAVPTLALFVLAQGRPLFLERYLNGIAPAYYVAFAAGIAALWPRRSRAARTAAAALALGLVFFVSSSAYALSNYYFDPAYAKAPDWRALSRFIAARQREGDILVQNFTDMSLVYYRAGNLPVITLPKDFWSGPADEKTLQQLDADYRRIWFIPAAGDFWDPDHFVENYLSRYSDREIDTRISSFRVQLYSTPREFQPGIIPLQARVGPAVLAGYRIEGLRGDTATLSGHATLRVVLYWRPEERTEKDLTVFVHLANAQDRVVAQQDRAPVGGTYPTSQWKPGELIVDGYDLPVDAPPGPLTVVVGMYDAATLARVPAFDAHAVRLPKDRVPLTMLTVVP